MVDYSPVFNKLTRESLLKFVEMYDLEEQIKKRTNKEELSESLKLLFEKDEEIEKNFQRFYLRTEEAGRKHIYIKRLKYSEDLKKDIKEKAKKYLSESKRTFDPLTDNDKIYISESDNLVLVKKIKINKVYNLVDKTEKENEMKKIYNIRIIHFIEFVKFDFKNSLIYWGYDSIGDYDDKKIIDKSLEHLIAEFITEARFHSLESYLTSEKIEKMRLLPNCITFSLSNKVKYQDQAIFKKAKGDLDEILKELKHDKYKLSEIKENNPNLDVQTNPLFGASFEHSIENDLDFKNSGVELYYFTNKSGIMTYFRIRIDISRDLLITFSDSITKEELSDVFVKFS
jgi:hypothetical protein